MKLILKYLRGYRKESILAPLLKMTEAILDLFVPLVVASIIDDGIAVGSKQHIVIMVLVMFLLAAVGLLISFIAQYFAAKAAVMSTAKMREDLFAHIQTLSFREMDTIGSSTFITRLTSDTNQVQNGINLCLRLLLRSPFIVFGAMIMAFRIDVSSAMIFVVVIPLLSIVVFGVMMVTKSLYKRIQAGLDRLLLLTRENLSGVRVIRAFHKEELEKKNFADQNEALTGLQLFTGKISGLTNPLTLVMVNLAIVVLIYRGAIQVDHGILTQGQVIALYNYMASILVELIKLANLIVSMTKGLACASRLQDVFDTRSSMTYGSLAWPEERDKSAGQDMIRFDHVSFTYPGGSDPALSDITFAAKKGETIGVIGGTGSGKSTLVNLVARFYDASAGEIRLRGHGIGDYSYEALRGHISVVPQKAQLFKGTILDNITFGYDQANEEEIEEALAISQAKEFVMSKEGGLMAPVEQGGKNLSGGQKQRLTLARALVRPSDILIMDDSASALDYATDARLRMAIKEMKRKPTVFIVSQRASSVMHADQILVLDDGELIAVGKHEALLEHCQIYQEIYASQFMTESVSGKEGR